ncbi:MAG: glycerol-3-phosphate responsive antiterminator [Enterocloster sp.]|jgi:glycerol uptake operon antiterminator|nr:glycerol-3-phosphate responsive antiterminator [Enterocloster sp.]
MKTTLQDIIKKNPIMAALCREEDLDDLCLSRVKLAYIFCGNLKTLPFIVERVRKAGIEPFVYMDFIDGLSSKDSAVEFVKYYTSAAGIVTTKSNQVRRAKALDLLAIQRFFVFDAISQANIRHQIKSCTADGVEILPGVILSVISDLSKESRIPFITGGFINTKNEIEAAMESGAAGITTSMPNLWFL